MNHFRDFSNTEGHVPPGRTIDNDAPQPLRQEFVDLIFHIAEHSEDLNPATIHRAATQSLGMAVAGQPCGGFDTPSAGTSIIPSGTASMI